jgi:hypothetical protein
MNRRAMLYRPGRDLGKGIKSPPVGRDDYPECPLIPKAANVSPSPEGEAGMRAIHTLIWAFPKAREYAHPTMRNSAAGSGPREKANVARV